MTQPKITITELDGSLGVLPPSSGRLMAVVGVSSSGTANVPASYGKVSALVAAKGYGPLVEAAARHIELTGDPVVVVNTGTTTNGACGTPDVTGVTGTSVVTADASVYPYDDYEMYFLVVTGGTRGTAGITFRYSFDGGKNMSALVALGTAITYTVPNSGVKVNFAAGTLVAGDYWSFRTTAPIYNAAQLGAALDALRVSTHAVEIVQIAGVVDGTTFDTLSTKRASSYAVGKFIQLIGNTRTPNLAESEATYLAAMDTIFSAKSDSGIALCAGSCRLISSVSGRNYRRPVSFVVASLEASVSEEINTADINLGALVGVSVRDSNGNPEQHDETANPGLDDSRYYVLRTWEGYQGVYPNRPRLFSAEGSDFQLVPHRRVLNLAHSALRAYFTRRLNKPILVNASTGYILEEEALEIESGARAVLRAVLLAKPKASGIEFTLSRTDNLLSTKTMTGQARVIPLAYPEFINLDLGFKNPALQTQAV